MKSSRSRAYVARRLRLTPEDRKWIASTVRRILAEVIATEARHGGYDGATPVEEDYVEEGKKAKRKRIGFKP